MNKIELFVLTLLIVFSFNTFSQDKPVESIATSKFLGASTCAPCHKNEKQGKQMDIWQKSKHSNSYKSLLSEEADKIAKEKGSDKKASETEACLKCHVPEFSLKANFSEKYKIEDGIQCETCHGAASEYKIVHMKDREKAKEKGLIVVADKEKFCKSCHNAESPTFREFNFEKMWSLIAHPLPKKN